MSLTLSFPLRGHQYPAIGPARLFAERDLSAHGLAAALACDLLEEDDVLIVAAAGNDAHPGNRPFARQPAAFDSVIGVGALGMDGNPAVYSNLADQPSHIGIATFGGDMDAGGAADPERGVLGVYTGEFPDGSKNENGWARWGGLLSPLRLLPESWRGCAARSIAARRPAEGVRGAGEVTPVPALEEVLTLRQGCTNPA